MSDYGQGREIQVTSNIQHGNKLMKFLNTQVETSGKKVASRKIPAVNIRFCLNTLSPFSCWKLGFVKFMYSTRFNHFFTRI